MSAPLRRTYPAGRTLAEQAADAIRNGIIKGEFEPGQALKEEELSSRLGVSRIPLREALRQLEGEGFVRIQPYCGAIVVPLSVPEARELGEIRSQLDCMALEFAIPNLDDATIDRVASLSHRLDREHDVVERTALSWELLENLFTPAQRPLLLNMILRLHRKSARYASVFGTLRQQKKAPSVYGKELLEAVRRRDVEGAKKVLTNAYANANKAVIRLLEDLGESNLGTIPASRRSRRYLEAGGR